MRDALQETDLSSVELSHFSPERCGVKDLEFWGAVEAMEMGGKWRANSSFVIGHSSFVIENLTAGIATGFQWQMKNDQ